MLVIIGVIERHSRIQCAISACEVGVIHNFANQRRRFPERNVNNVHSIYVVDLAEVTHSAVN